MQLVDDVIRLTRKGQIIDGIRCRRIVVQAPNVVIKNSEVFGDGTKSNHGLIDFTHKAASGGVLNTLIKPTKPTLWQTGIMGHDYSAHGVKVRRTVDGFGVYNTAKPKDGRVDVVLDDVDVDELMYFTNDPNHSDRHTHNDAVQIQGGSHVTILNSRLHAILFNTGPWGHTATGQAIGVTPNVSKVSWVHIEGNDLDGGAQPITLIPGKFGKVELGAIIGNTFGTRGHFKRAGAAHPSVEVDWRGNKWSDGKEAKLVVTKSL